VVHAVAPKPVNLLIGSTSEFTLADVAAMGVRRISVGGALARTAWVGFLQAATEIAERGTFTSLGKTLPSAEFERWFDGP
jgi:2-methylisocitrate lyase-like PEP mutase family enzyme